MKRLLLLFLTISIQAKAEYRAYQYLVEYDPQFNLSLKSKPQIVISTLNPRMYTTYHGSSSVKIELLRTWICSGFTSKKDICDHPYDQSIDEEKML